MALPIRPTPTLNEKESEQFCEMLEKQSNDKSFPKSNKEKIEQARERAKKDALNRKK